MNLDQMRTFIDVVDQGSISKASEEYYISKQAMLKQIERLEQEIGTVLLLRSKRGIEPTQAGKIFYAGAKKILRDEEILIAKCRSQTQKEVLRIGSVEHQVLLNPVTEAFSKKYPEVQIQRIVHPNHSGEWRVQHNIMDVGETFISDHPDLDHVSYTPLTTYCYVAAMRRNHPLSKKKTVTLEELSYYPLFVYPQMVKQQYVKELEQAFTNSENLIKRDDVDNQVSAAYECINSDAVLLTANPFIQSINELKKVPLSIGWTREYGIIYKTPTSEIVQNYIDLAIQCYTE